MSNNLTRCNKFGHLCNSLVGTWSEEWNCCSHSLWYCHHQLIHYHLCLIIVCMFLMNDDGEYDDKSCHTIWHTGNLTALSVNRSKANASTKLKKLILIWSQRIQHEKYFKHLAAVKNVSKSLSCFIIPSLVESYKSLEKLACSWLPCQILGIRRSVLGLVGPLSVYCEWGK